MKEKGSFITLMESTYLSLLNGNPDINDLLQYSRLIDNQVQYKITREADNFFYAVTPEDYYASEHEIIWMHYLLSWGFSLKGDFVNARVETKKAANLLSMEWSPKGRFDDPFMRVFLAALWTMCGDWEEAQVDLRAAAAMDRQYSWAKELAYSETKPSNLIIILCGTGPETIWDPQKKKNVIRGIRKIGFEMNGAKVPLTAQNDGRPFALNMTSDASGWYNRHLRRNNEISNIIDDSKYAQRMTGAALKAAGISTAGYLLAGALITASIGAGGGLIYLDIAYNGQGYIGGVGLMIAMFGSYEGYGIFNDTTQFVRDQLNKDLDISNTYRYVRFLPEYAWFGWSNSFDPQFTIKTKNNESINSKVTITNSNPVNGVTIIYFPDSAEKENSQCHFSWN
jgi:hypothetical protein